MAKRSRSGLKHKRQSAARQVDNQAVLSRLKTLTRAAVTSPDRMTQAIAELDRAARKGIIHPNAAARKKSRLMRRAHGGIAGTSESGTKVAARPQVR